MITSRLKENYIRNSEVVFKMIDINHYITTKSRYEERGKDFTANEVESILDKDKRAVVLDKSGKFIIDKNFDLNK